MRGETLRAQTADHAACALSGGSGRNGSKLLISSINLLESGLFTRNLAWQFARRFLLVAVRHPVWMDRLREELGRFCLAGAG
jgi:hypothetical protein